MRFKILPIVFFFLVLFLFTYIESAFSHRIPSKDSNIGYLYVFGRDGKVAYGAKKEPQVIFLRVPKEYSGDIQVSIFDPDISGAIDEKSGRWNTETRFSIFGGKNAFSSLREVSKVRSEDIYEGTLIDAEIFALDKSYDRKFYYFAPIDPSAGEEIDNFRYFKIIAEGLSGDDNNIFSLNVEPDIVESFSYSLSFRLSESTGAKMALYPEIPLDAKFVVEHNYDLDKSGGSIEVITSDKTYKIKGSTTGKWATTKINVPSTEEGKRWVYEITKGPQRNSNMSMYLTTRDRRAIPVFFEPGTNGPKKIVLTDTQEFASERLSCKTFTFDASQSYDPDSQEMIYFWDFGDGTTSKDIKTTHIYREAGKYLVKLTVIDNSAADCNTAMTKHVVNVNEPPQAVAKAVNLTCVGAEVSFDGTQSNDNPEDTLKYIWDFGDGETTEGAKVTHVYSKGGDYQVALTVKDDSDSACDTDIDKFGVAINTPPVAEAGEDINLCKEDPNDSLKVVFDGSSSKDEDEDSLIYSWDLGDGTVEQGKVISHNYEKGGEYLVKLLVTDDSGAECNSSESTKRIALNRAPMANAGKDLQICLSKEAHFDATTSYDNDGDPITCTWDFGDGETAQGFEVSHIYRNGGIYKVGLMVDDNSGTACSKTYDTLSIDVNSSPNAEIVAMNKGCVDNSVEFDGSSSKDPDGDELNYTWDFGDGTFARGANVKHSYAKGGLYKVALALEDGKKLDCSGAKKEHYININTPPVADAGPDRAICCVNKLVEFDASKSFDRDNDSLTYTWDLGDGQIKQGQKITHSYKDTGIYKVVLTVADDSDSECNTSVDSLVSIVNAKPVPVIEII